MCSGEVGPSIAPRGTRGGGGVSRWMRGTHETWANIRIGGRGRNVVVAGV